LKYILLILFFSCYLIKPGMAQNHGNRQKAIDLTAKGLETLAKDSVEKAILWFKKAIHADSTYAEPRFRLGEAYLGMHQFEKAYSSLFWLLQHSNEHAAEVNESLGDILLFDTGIDKHAHVKALKYYSNALKLDSVEGSYWAKPGLLLFDFGDFENAAVHLQRAVDLNYISAEIYSKLAFSYSRLDNNKRAVLYFNKAIEKDPKNMADFANRGYALMSIHQLNDALDDLNFYLKYDSTDASVWYNLGHTQYGLGQLDAAIISMKKVLQLDPAYGDTWFRLGLTYADKGEYKNAINAFDRAIALHPNEAYLYYNRAVAKAKNADGSDYCTDLKKAATLGYRDADKMLEKICRH
jgi:tetratricopeptide (TPR) repeat protein